MAKVGLWLRGARGKLAGATLYKGASGTEIREVVTPTNPMTEGQAMQRMVFSTVGHAWKVLYPIIANKWQGVSNKRDLFKEFTRNNLTYIKAGVLAGKIDHCFTIMGANAFAPNEYQIAKGTLNPITPIKLTGFAKNDTGYNGVSIACANVNGVVNVEIYNYNDYVRVLALLGCRPGDTITVITVETAEENPIAKYNQADNPQYIINEQYITFKREFDGGMYQSLIFADDGSIAEDFLSDQSEKKIIWNPKPQENIFEVGIEYNEQFDYYAAGTIIRSRRVNPDNEYDLRVNSSNARFLVAESDFDNGFNSATAERVLPSYMGIADPTEDQFLNKEIPEYPVYSGAEPIENVQLLITNDDLIQDIEDTIFNGTLNDTNSKVNIFGRWLVDDDNYPKIVSNVEFDSIVVNGVKFVKTGTGGATRLYYTPENWASYFSWFRIITEGEKGMFDSQKILLYKDNNVYTVPYDFICRILFADDREHSTIGTAVVGFKGTLYDLYSLSTPMRVPIKIDEQALVSIFAEVPIRQLSIGFINDRNETIWQEIDGSIEHSLAWHFESDSLYWGDIFHYNTTGQCFIDLYESLFEVHAELKRV